MSAVYNMPVSTILEKIFREYFYQLRLYNDSYQDIWSRLSGKTRKCMRTDFAHSKSLGTDVLLLL